MPPVGVSRRDSVKPTSFDQTKKFSTVKTLLSFSEGSGEETLTILLNLIATTIIVILLIPQRQIVLRTRTGPNYKSKQAGSRCWSFVCLLHPPPFSPKYLYQLLFSAELSSLASPERTHRSFYSCLPYIYLFSAISILSVSVPSQVLL